MKHNIISFLKNYWILLSFLGIYTTFVLPLCFQNNESSNMVAAEHVDSGSILSSILQLSDKSLPNSFYNQNIPYHTGYYGFPYNSIVFWTFLFLKYFFKSYTTNNFYIFPLTAKLLNFLFASLSIIYLYQLSRKIFKYNLSKVILLSLVIIFPEFLHYTFHIKPDILGLLFSIISLNYLYNFLQKPNNNKSIIKANILGGLSVLCKQPHIFIIVALFFGFILTLKGNIKEKIIKFVTVYFYSVIFFLLLFFLIHPYAFIEPKTFILRQISMTDMTSASYIDNFNYWLPTYTGSPLLFITAFTPFIFILLNLFKKFRNKITLFLSLVSIYLITYLIWLTLKVGPMRFINYLIPILPFSIMLYSYIFDYSLSHFFQNKIIIKKIFYLAIATIIIILSIKCFKFYIFYTSFTTSFTTKYVIQAPYIFKETEMYKATKKFENQFKIYQTNNKSIIYSISLPINPTFYKKTDNTWQGLTTSDYFFIDFTVGWEKPYDYWKNIAIQNGLNKEILFIDKINKEKNIVLFYK